MTKNVNPKLFLFGAFGHLLCWLGGDLLLYFMPNGPLNVMGLFDYQTTAAMLEGASTLQFTLSGYNLFTFSPLKIIDPEGQTTRTGDYPLVKLYNFGLNINF